MRSGEFDSVQVCYNLSRQAAGRHLLDEAREANMGVNTMRPMTSGILQRQLEYLAPEWLENDRAFEVCLSFLLSDSRVHTIPVGMRWSHEVRKNADFVEDFEPKCDIALLPRMTGTVYETDDARWGDHRAL